MKKGLYRQQMERAQTSVQVMKPDTPAANEMQVSSDCKGY